MQAAAKLELANPQATPDEEFDLIVDEESDYDIEDEDLADEEVGNEETVGSLFYMMP